MLRTALLAGAGAVCLVTARLIRGSDGLLGEFLTAFGLFSVVFVLDDSFQVTSMSWIRSSAYRNH
jgi:hypothetical protein